MDDRSAPSVIAAYRAATTCSDALREANLRATLDRDVRRDRDVGETPIPIGRARRWLVAGAVAAAAVLVAWLARDALVGDATPQRPGTKDAAQHDAAHEATRGDARAVSAGARTSEAPAEMPAAAPREPEAPAPSAPVRARPPSDAVRVPAPSVVAPAIDATAREAALLHEARRALDDGATDDARAALDRHRREFERGALVEERWMLQVRVECSVDVARARATASAFRDASPRSTAAARLVADPCPRKKP